jgi:type I restriction enzyme S subunit
MKEGWEYRKFKDVYPIMMGKTPPRNDNSYWDVAKETHNRWVSIADISRNEGKFITDTKEYVSDKGAKNINLVRRGSLLMSFKLTIGKMAFAGEDLYTNEAIIAIPEDKSYNLRFMYYYLLSYDWKSLSAGKEKVKGATLNKSSIGEIKLPILSLPEQQRIVSYLDSTFAKIDAVAKNAEESLNEAKALFQSALAKMMEPKEGWEEKTLKDVGITQTGTTPSKSNPVYYGDYIPFIRPSEIDYDGKGSIDYNSELKLSEEGLQKGRLFKAGSILMVCIGATISKVGYCVKDVSCNQQINVLKPNACYNYKYIFYAMSNPEFKKVVMLNGKSAQATLPIINKSKWEQLIIPVPPRALQDEIVEKLETLNHKVVDLTFNLSRTLSECAALKQSILRQTFE